MSGTLLPATICLVLSLALLGAAPATAATNASTTVTAAPDDRANIVLILVDDMRADELRFLPKTRRLIGRRGTTFTHAISPHPLCCPARAELMTGQYAQNMGVKENGGRWGGMASMRRPHNTIGAWTQDAGYRTAFIGKYLNGYTARWGAIRGWDDWQALTRRTHLYWRPGFFHSRLDRGYTTRAVHRRAARVIRTTGDDPLLLYVFHPAPHEIVREDETGAVKYSPPAPEPKYRDHYQRYRHPVLTKAAFNEQNISDLPADLRRGPRSKSWIIKLARARAQALRSVDDSVADLVAVLRRTGKLSTTYIVVSSDNGFLLGEHRIGGKNVLFDEALDVPLLVRGPDVPRRSTVHRPVTLVDLPATFLDWSGATPRRRPDGLPLLQPDRARDTILIQTGTREPGSQGWGYRGVTTSRYLFARSVRNPRNGILFDRVRDPQQMRNVFRRPAYAPIVRELSHRTKVLRSCSGPRSCNRSFGPVPAPK